MVSLFGAPEYLLLTDGNELSADNVCDIINHNSEVLDAKIVESSILRWDHQLPNNLENSFDVIICSDCLFFDAFRKPLSNCSFKLLKVSVYRFC